MVASSKGHLHIVRMLLNEFSARHDKADKDGMTALLYACSKGQATVVRYLLRGRSFRMAFKIPWQIERAGGALIPNELIQTWTIGPRCEMARAHCT